MAYLLGPEWYALEGGSRWMPKRATLRIGTLRSPSEKLYLSGFCSEAQPGPFPVRVAVNGTPLQEFTMHCIASRFHAILSLPDHLVQSKWLDLTIESGRTFQGAHDGRELGLSFGTFEIRE
jgi:hypothetical protein